MNSIVRIALVAAALIAASPLLLIVRPAHAQAANGNGNGKVNNCDGPCYCDGEFCDPPPRDPPPQQQAPPPPVTGADSSGASINGLADQRFNQMITNRVLGSVLLGVNEQVNCHDCLSAFGSAGSFSAGIHGRKELTGNLSLLAGLAYTQYSEGGYHVTTAPIGAVALRYDFTDWGPSRPFFDIGTILTPYEKVRYSRFYVTSLGPVSLESSTNAAKTVVPSMLGKQSLATGLNNI